MVQLRNLVKQVGNLNFYGDEDIEQMVKKVDGQLTRPAQTRNLSQITTNLRDIATVTRASLIGLGEQPRLARGLGVAEVPTGEMVRQARRGLGIEEVVEMPVRRGARDMVLEPV